MNSVLSGQDACKGRGDKDSLRLCSMFDYKRLILHMPTQGMHACGGMSSVVSVVLAQTHIFFFVPSPPSIQRHALCTQQGVSFTQTSDIHISAIQLCCSLTHCDGLVVGHQLSILQTAGNGTVIHLKSHRVGQDLGRSIVTKFWDPGRKPVQQKGMLGDVRKASMA